MSWKDKMKEGAGNIAPRFETIRLEVKESLDSPTGYAFFKWDKATNENVLFANKIKGAIIGQAMSLNCFDSNFGKNGGSMRSNYIFDTNKVAVFGPAGARLFDGTLEDAKAFMTKVSGDRASVKKILFVSTEEGVVSISTNITIAIDQLKAIGLKVSTNMVELTPMVADFSNGTLSAKAVEILGKLAKKNPPKYTHIDCVEEITDEWAEANDLEAAIDAFIEYRNHNTTKGAAPIDTPRPIVNNREEDDTIAPDDSDDDLPF